MRKQKAVINYTQFRDNDLTEIAQLIVNKLTANPHFPSPQPTLVVVQGSISDYSTALIKSKDGTKKDTADKNARRKILEGHLSQLADYVNDTAQGNLVMLEGSGCPLTKQFEPVGILPPPESFEVSETKNPGQVYIKISKVRKATGYLVLYYFEEDFDTEPPDSKWYRRNFSKTTGILKGLLSGKKCIFKAAALSPEANETERYNFSETVEKYIQ